MTIRAIDPAGYKPPASHYPGPAPSLLWLPIADLVVDEAYQRKITKAGRAAVQAIVESFDWSQFSPVIVAAIEGGVYAIIDGQHRTTAAAACGIKNVPCQLVLADRRAQAKAFAAVNGKVLKITSLQVYRAAVEAGEPWAAGVAEVCAAAGVTVLRYPMPAHSRYRPPHSTMSVRPIEEIIKRQGKDMAIAVLSSITRTSLGDDPGVLGRAWMTAIANVLGERPDLAVDEARRLALFDGLDAGAAYAEAHRESMRVGVSEALTIVLRKLLDDSERRAAA